jgi:KRAB domain-containing zinc finger protein
LTESAITLRQHVLRKNTPDTYHCPYCGLGFSHIFKLHQHFQVGHDATKKLYPCFRCKKIYLRKHEYKLHECTHKNTDNPKPENVASKCDRCKQEFFNSEEFACHQFLECEDDNNKCVTCGKEFETLRKLICHKKHHEPVEKLFVCDICGDAFVNATRLQSHRSRHSNKRPFQCPVCLAAFRLKFMLISHMKVHEEKQFECAICWKKFRHYIGIRSHMTSHLENRADYVKKDATCDLCGKRMTKNTLGKHLKSHAGECKMPLKYYEKKTKFLFFIFRRTGRAMQNLWKRISTCFAQVSVKRRLSAKGLLKKQKNLTFLHFQKPTLSESS